MKSTDDHRYLRCCKLFPISLECMSMNTCKQDSSKLTIQLAAQISPLNVITWMDTNAELSN